MKIELEAFTNEHNKDFLQGMIQRMDMSFSKYGRFRPNYKGSYDSAFCKDLRRTLVQFLERWDNEKFRAATTTAPGNAMLFVLRRLVAYLGGKGDVPGNTEYLMDAANGLMIEFECPQVPGAYFKPTDEKGSTGFAGLSEKEAESYR